MHGTNMHARRFYIECLFMKASNASSDSRHTATFFRGAGGRRNQVIAYAPVVSTSLLAMTGSNTTVDALLTHDNHCTSMLSRMRMCHTCLCSMYPSHPPPKSRKCFFLVAGQVKVSTGRLLQLCATPLFPIVHEHAVGALFTQCVMQCKVF